MWQLYLMFGLFTAVIVALSALVGWYVNLITLCVLTGIYVGMLRGGWTDSLQREDKNFLVWGDILYPLLAPAVAWFTAAYVRGWFDIARQSSIPSTLRDWFLR